VGKITTTLPTEEGLYLFSGLRRGWPEDMRDARKSRFRAEKVRVFTNGAGKLMYVGLDVFYEPESAIGAWMRIDECEALEEQGQAIVDYMTAKEAMAVYMEKEYRPQDCTRNRFIDFMAATWQNFYVWDEDRRKKIAEIAVREGWAKEDTDD